MRERELQTMRFSSLHLRYLFFRQAAKAPSTEGGQVVPVDRRNTGWRHEAGLEFCLYSLHQESM